MRNHFAFVIRLDIEHGEYQLNRQVIIIIHKH